MIDHDELWTGWGAFELRFSDRGGYYFDAKIGARGQHPTRARSDAFHRAVAPGERRTQEPVEPRTEPRGVVRGSSCFGCSTTSRRSAWPVGSWKNSMRFLEPTPKDPDSDALFAVAFCLGCRRSCDMHGGEGEKTERVVCGFVKAREGAGSLAPVRVVKDPKESSYAGLKRTTLGGRWVVTGLCWRSLVFGLSQRLFYNHNLLCMQHFCRLVDLLLSLSFLYVRRRFKTGFDH